MEFTTITDAQTFVSNSGVADWDWGNNASNEGFAEFLYKNYDGMSRDDEVAFEAALTAYLTSVGENPADYL